MTKNNDEQGIIFREVSSQYNLGDSTLRNWIDAGVCGDSNNMPTRKINGKLTKIFLKEHIEKLERFLLLRWYLILSKPTARFDLDELIKLHLNIENGQLQIGIDCLNELEEILNNLRDKTQRHNQSLFAKLHGDPEIDPLEDDFDE
jgi:hypothetical protein